MSVQDLKDLETKIKDVQFKKMYLTSAAKEKKIADLTSMLNNLNIDLENTIKSKRSFLAILKADDYSVTPSNQGTFLRLESLEEEFEDVLVPKIVQALTEYKAIDSNEYRDLDKEIDELELKLDTYLQANPQDASALSLVPIIKSNKTSIADFVGKIDQLEKLAESVQKIPSFRLPLASYVNMNSRNGMDKSFNSVNLNYHKKAIKLLSVEINDECKLLSTSAIEVRLNDLINNYPDSPVYADNLKNARCAFKELLQNFTRDFEPKDNYFKILNKKVNASFRPAKLLSDTSAEGVAWSIGYKNKGPYAVLKYGVQKIDIGTFTTPNQVNDINLDQNLYHEILAGLLLNKLVEKTPNFMYVFSGFFCSVPRSIDANVTGVEGNYKYDEFCKTANTRELEICMISELVNSPKTFYELNHAFQQKYDVKVTIGNNKVNIEIGLSDIVKVWMQVVCSLAIAYNEFKFVHGDLHGNNVLCYYCPTEQTLDYELFDQETSQIHFIEIKSHWIAKIIDYGRCKFEYNSRVFSPLTVAHNGKDPVFSSANVENLIFGDNSYFPFTYDILRLGTSFFDASNSIIRDADEQADVDLIDDANNHISWKVGRFSEGHIDTYSKFKELCEIDKSYGGYYRFCKKGETSFDKYWKELDDLFSNPEDSDTSMTLKNLVQIALSYRDFFDNNGISLS